VNRSCAIGIVLLLFISASAGAQGGGGQGAARPAIDWNSRMPWAVWEAGMNAWWNNFPRTALGVEPFKIFDNVYYVGIQTGQALLIPTSAGHILIDATYAETADMVLDGIRKLKFDPADIKYILISHGHADHFAGVGRIKQVATGARIGTSAADWGLIEAQLKTANPANGLPFSRDLLIEDGQVITLGDTSIKVLVTPGHSAGALAFDIPARIGRRTYRIVNPRVGIRIPPAMTESYIASIEKLRAAGPWDGYLPEHPFLAMRVAQITPRDFYVGPAPLPKPVGPNASVQGKAAVDAFFDDLLKVARQKLAAEKAAAASQPAAGR
jgi:hypothetical protein